MSQLQDNLDEILRQKNVYLLPQNIKKDVTVLGITGTLESGSGSGDVKLFDTVAHMQADPNPSDGDLAIVYREEIQPVTEDSEFSSCIFPNEVALDEAFTDNIYGRFRAVDSSSSYFDGMVDMSSSSFRFDGYGDSGEIRVQYTSSDGITYTRTDGGEELQEFGITIKWEPYEEFNNVISNFMKIGENYFDGLYDYSNYTEKNEIVLYKFDELTIENNSITNLGSVYGHYDYTKIVRMCEAEGISTNYIGMTVINDKLYMVKPSVSSPFYLFIYNDKLYIGSDVNWMSRSWTFKEVDLENETFVSTITYTNTDLTAIYTKSSGGYYALLDIPINAFAIQYRDGTIVIPYLTKVISNNVYIINTDLIKTNSYYTYKKYNMSSTQFDVTDGYVYDGYKFYGKNGVGVGSFTANINNTFTDKNAEIYAKLQMYYNNITPRVLTDNDKDIDTDVYIIPVNSMGEPLLDTSAMTNMSDLFRIHQKIKCIPKLDTSNVTNMSEAFAYCDNLEYIALMDTSNVTNMSEMLRDDKNLKEIPLFNTSNVTDMASMCWGCDTITTFPLLDTSNVTDMTCMLTDCDNLVSIPLLNTSKVTGMGSMFWLCKKLTTVPLLDTSNVTNMGSMFGSCTSLNNTSLNNILAMCTNATKISSNKTLKYIGLTQAQATTCTTLSNYQAFVNAGWTTGY